MHVCERPWTNTTWYPSSLWVYDTFPPRELRFPSLVSLPLHFEAQFYLAMAQSSPLAGKLFGAVLNILTLPYSWKEAPGYLSRERWKTATKRVRGTLPRQRLPKASIRRGKPRYSKREARVNSAAADKDVEAENFKAVVHTIQEFEELCHAKGSLIGETNRVTVNEKRALTQQPRMKMWKQRTSKLLYIRYKSSRNFATPKASIRPDKPRYSKREACVDSAAADEDVEAENFKAVVHTIQ